MAGGRMGVFQVIDQPEAGRRRLGSAFAIFGNRVLTCAHVLCAHSGYGRRTAGAGSGSIVIPGHALFNSVATGMLTGTEWFLHDRFDVACGRPAPGVSLANPLAMSVAELTIGTKVTCLGFTAAVPETITHYERSVAASDTERGLLLDAALAHGFSGGPAMVGEAAVGVVYADALEQNLGLVVPLTAINQWIETVLPVEQGPPGTHILDSVPIASTLTVGGIPEEVIDVFAGHFEGGGEAKRFVEQAMVLRKAHNHEGFSDKQILVPFLDIRWDAAPRHLWYRIFETSLKRSLRTLAALFYATGAPDPRFLPDSQRKMFEEFKERLSRSK